MSDVLERLWKARNTYHNGRPDDAWWMIYDLISEMEETEAADPEPTDALVERLEVREDNEGWPMLYLDGEVVADLPTTKGRKVKAILTRLRSMGDTHREEGWVFWSGFDSSHQDCVCFYPDAHGEPENHDGRAILVQYREEK